MRPDALLATALGLVFAVPTSPGPSETDLEERFRRRHPVIEQLKDAGMLGETTGGWISPVDPSVLDETAMLDGDARKIRDLVEEENRDRRQLYELIAERTGATADTVAMQAAIRNYRLAEPNHYLRTKSGRWLRKWTVEG